MTKRETINAMLFVKLVKIYTSMITDGNQRDFHSKDDFPNFTIRRFVKT
jgi:hypothetical protein